MTAGTAATPPAATPRDRAAGSPPGPRLDDADRAFLRAFDALELSAFSHRDHVRLAWATLAEAELEAALARVSDGLRAFATAAGAPDKFDADLTARWLRAVARRMAPMGAHRWPDFEAAHPDLFDKGAALD